MFSKEKVRPFLKWAGGKYRLVETICSQLPEGKRLIEPFVGSGAVFLNTEFERYLLADINPDLIDLYQRLQQQGPDFIDFSESWFQKKWNSEKQYYRLRKRFNTLKACDEKAALFIYLNRHGYNGLCRYSTKGIFNVPFGQYVRPYFPRKEMHYFWKKSKKATFVCCDFETVLKRARKGNTVYCDPPYVPLSKTAHFTQYDRARFSQSDQHRLAMVAAHLAQRGVDVVVSNHSNEETQRLYKNASITTFSVTRTISCQGNQRKKANELLALFSSRPKNSVKEGKISH